jgi:hypothetical protein
VWLGGSKERERVGRRNPTLVTKLGRDPKEIEIRA